MFWDTPDKKGLCFVNSPFNLGTIQDPGVAICLGQGGPPYSVLMTSAPSKIPEELYIYIYPSCPTDHCSGWSRRGSTISWPGGSAKHPSSYLILSRSRCCMHLALFCCLTIKDHELSIYCSFPFIVENPDLETQKVLETQNDMAFAEMPIFIASAKVVLKEGKRNRLQGRSTLPDLTVTPYNWKRGVVQRRSENIQIVQ